MNCHDNIDNEYDLCESELEQQMIKSNRQITN